MGSSIQRKYNVKFRKIHTLIFITLIVFQGLIFSMDFPIEIKRPSEETIKVKPGAIFDISLKVTNIGNSDIDLEENIVLPDGWNLVFQPFAFEVKSISSQLRIFSISVPGWADAGEYEILYEVIGDSGKRETLSIKVKVSSIISFSVSKVNSPEYAIAGEEYSVYFSINNNGNVPVEVEIDVSDNLSYDIQVKDATLVIPAKESILSSATITINESISAQTTHRVKVEVKEKSTGVIKELRFNTIIIPQENALANQFVLVPCVFTIGTTFKDDDIEFHSKLKLNGFIDSERRLYVNLELEMLNFKELPDFKLNSLSYNYENFRIRYGKYKPPNYSGFKYDKALESISAELSIENFHLHSFASTGTEYYGIYVDWIKSDEYEYFAALDGKRSEEEKLQVLSIGLMNNYENFYYDGTLRFPFLDSESEGMEFDFDSGYSFKIDPMDFKIDLSYDHGNYVGVKDDSFEMDFNAYLFDDFISASYGFKRYEPFDFSKDGLVNYYFLKGSLEGFISPDILFKIDMSKNFTGNRQTAGIEIDNSFKTNLRLFWNIYTGEKSDINLSLSSKINYKENNFVATSTANLNLYTKIDDFTDFKINAKVNIVNTDNTLINPNANVSFVINHNSPYDFEIKSSLNLSMNFETMTKDASATFILNKYFDENGKLSFALDLEFEEELKKVIGKVSFDLSKKFLNGFELGGSVKYKFNDEEENFVQTSFIVNKYFKDRNKLQGKVTYDFNKNEDFLSRFSFGIEYTHYFNLPALPRTDLSSVEGYIYYDDGEHKRGLSGAKVYLNNKIAITSEEGRYYFSGVKEGDHFLKVDNSNIDMNMISVETLPIKISLEKGEERKMQDIFFIDRSEILIKIIPDKISGKTLDTDVLSKMGRTSVNLQGIKIIIRNEDSYYILYTSKNGEAGMERLKPGEWNLKIITSSLPEGYAITQNEYNITLYPGRKINVEVQLKEEMMEIIFIDSGDL